ncbi:MAG: DUF2461 domain-containing protein [Bacteroidota bacterium]
MITTTYIQFFKELEQNNTKEWFHKHKKRYENEVKQPFLDLLTSILPAIKMLEPEILMNAKDALFRINRDIRFAKDKTPYNTMMKAGFSAGGRKSELPSYYLGISADMIHVGGGVFNVKGNTLKKIRRLISEETEAFCKIVESDTFKNHFGTLKGEQAKRLDKASQATLERTPYITNKQFYAMPTLPLASYLNTSDLQNVIVEYFKAIQPLNVFLKRAF